MFSSFMTCTWGGLHCFSVFVYYIKFILYIWASIYDFMFYIIIFIYILFCIYFNTKSHSSNTNYSTLDTEIAIWSCRKHNLAKLSAELKGAVRDSTAVDNDSRPSDIIVVSKEEHLVMNIIQ